jgi:hypothetical protein
MSTTRSLKFNKSSYTTQGQAGRIVTYVDPPVPELFAVEHGFSAAGDGGSVSSELGRKVAHIARYLPCLHDKQLQANLSPTINSITSQ